MPISEICIREVSIAERKETVLQATKLMKKNNVGILVIVKERTDRGVPVGIVTYHDFVVKIIAAEAVPSFVRVEDIMAPELSIAPENWAFSKPFNTCGARKSDACRL